MAGFETLKNQIKKDTKEVLHTAFGADPPGLPPYAWKGFPRGVEQVITDTAKATGHKIWRGIMHAAASGFGKGVLITAALVVGFMAFGSGIIALDAGLEFGAQALVGAGKGLYLLSKGAGIAALAIGGIIGSIMDIRNEQNQISAAVAEAQAKAYEAVRIQKQAERAEHLTNTLPEVNFTSRETQRRAIPAVRGK